MILRALEETGQDKRRAAQLLGISLKTLYNKLAKYGIQAVKSARSADAGGGRSATAGAARGPRARSCTTCGGRSTRSRCTSRSSSARREGDAGAEESLRVALEQLGRLAEMVPAALAVAALELGPLRPLDLGVLATRVRDAEGARAVTIAPGDWPSRDGRRSAAGPRPGPPAAQRGGGDGGGRARSRRQRDAMAAGARARSGARLGGGTPHDQSQAALQAHALHQARTPGPRSGDRGAHRAVARRRAALRVPR